MIVLRKVFMSSVSLVGNVLDQLCWTGQEVKRKLFGSSDRSKQLFDMTSV
jgi:hypothetical protein